MDMVFQLLFAGAVLLPMVLLAALCVNCRRHHQPNSIIQQRYSSEDYTPTSGFRLVPSYQPPAATSWVTPSNHLSPMSQQNEQIRRHHSFSPTENESNASYDTPGEAEYVNPGDEEEEEGGGYLIVLPSEPVAEILRQSNQSIASTLSSEPKYENVKLECVVTDNSDAENYENVDPKHNPSQIRTPRDSPGVSPTRPIENGESDDSDEDGSPYVNAPKPKICDLQPFT